MLRRRLLLVTPLMALIGALGGCGRPTGDFGRAEPSVIHDRVMPAAGGAIAKWGRDELVSGFNHTDDEGVLYDRAWGFVRPPHHADWLNASLIEGQRTRILPELDSKLSVAAYYENLRLDPYRSSEARYTRMIRDMQADTALVGPFWRQAAAVRDADDERLRAWERRSEQRPKEMQNAIARVEENARVVDWVWRSLRFRLRAYKHAIERIQVETPSTRLYDLNLAYNDLVAAIAEAELGTKRTSPGPWAQTKPGRYIKSEEKVPQK
ncbi:MAG: hypothetical protein JNM13_17795 [Hyphomicrobiaceae bacterium]|nr:hypothetical protein [Hyphomicrobiaceae bacterium]